MCFVSCPNCGKKLCKCKAGSEISIQCPTCRAQVHVMVHEDAIAYKWANKKNEDQNKSNVCE